MPRKESARGRSPSTNWRPCRRSLGRGSVLDCGSLLPLSSRGSGITSGTGWQELLYSQSARGLAHSTSWRIFRRAYQHGSVLDCDSPLPLFAPHAHTVTSTVMLVSQPNISTTFTQIVCWPGLP